MFIELWERLRGYDKWIVTDATVLSAKVQRHAHYGRDGSVSYTYSSNDELAWTDLSGERRSAQFTISDHSPFYQVIDGESVALRYNPSAPDDWYCRDLLRARLVAASRRAIGVLAFLLMLGLLIGLNILTHRSR